MNDVELSSSRTPSGAGEWSESTVTSEPGVELWAALRLPEPGSAALEATPLLVPNAIYLRDDWQDLAEERPVVFYDLRNRGRSPAIDDPKLLERGVHGDVEDLEAVRRHYGFERVCLLGHSYLGMVVILHALAHPERVERIVQIGPIGPRPAQTYEPPLACRDEVLADAGTRMAALRQRIGEGLDGREAAREWFAIMSRIMVGDPSAARRVVRTELLELRNEWPQRFERYLATSIWPSLQAIELGVGDLASLSLPVLVIHGTRDRNAPYGAGRDWAADLPNARLLTVSGAGHVPWLEAPELVKGAVAGFLRGAWPEEAARVADT